MKCLKIYSLIFILALVSCKERYTPNTSSTNHNILVVDGMINAGADSTFIKLSRTVPLGSKNVANPEIGATLIIETSANDTYTLVEKGRGTYVAPPLNFGLNKKYRLKIKTRNNANYLSDFVDVAVAPQIDSVNFAIKPSGLQLYVNASDPTNKTRYYRWDYEETWIFYAQYNSNAKWEGGPNVVERPSAESIYQCWASASSSTITIGSSAKLSKDVIHLAPLTDIVSNSEKLTEKYSILVKQYALTKEAYEFWENLKKNTESLGSIFDVLPSQLTGNIQNTTDVDEPVIGYISAGTIKTKRIFITKAQLPPWKPLNPYQCMIDTVRPKDQADRFASKSQIPIEIVPGQGGGIDYILGASRQCVDCTIRGTTRRPIFWQ